MKHLQTFESFSVNEKFDGGDFLSKLLNSFSKNIDMKKLQEYILPHKELIKGYYLKYVKDGVVDSQSMYNDFSKFNFSTNEGFYDDYADDLDNNSILRFMYKLFVRWPKTFIKGLWEFFHFTVIETFKDGGLGIVMSFFGILAWILTAILTFLIGFLIVEYVDLGMNGLERGKVKTELRFEPHHYELHTHTVFSGKSMFSYTTNDYVADRWHATVEGDNGRIESWVTYNQDLSKSTKVGQEINNDDNWIWNGTIKK